MAGNQPSRTEKTRIRISPIQKIGTLKPIIENAMIPFEIQLSGRSPA